MSDSLQESSSHETLLMVETDKKYVESLVRSRVYNL